jgi:hypothetical protein
MELESNNSLSLLDCNITKSNGRFQTSVFRKSTFTGLNISIFNFFYFRFKLNGLQSLLHCGFRICSTFHAMHSEFEFLRNIFSLNGFPSGLVFTQIKKFMSKRYSEVVPEPDRRVVYCSLPYFGHAYEDVKRIKRFLYEILSGH